MINDPEIHKPFADLMTRYLTLAIFLGYFSLDPSSTYS